MYFLQRCWVAVIAMCFAIGVAHASLPNGYTQLGYIESTGTQYIDTQFVPSANYKHTISFAVVGTSNAGYVTGTGIPRGGNVKILNGTSMQIWGNTVGGSTSAEIASATGTFTSKTMLVMDLHDGAFSDIYLNDQKINTSNKTDIITPNKLFLFASGATSSIPLRIYYDKIEQNNTLVRNLIPARRDSDSVLGMYDTVSQTFFTNSGTGTFIAGPKLEQYINTAGATTSAGTNFTTDKEASIYAAWVHDCEPGENATCSLVVATDGTATYTTGCTGSGYHMESGSGTYNPVCRGNEYTIIYNSNRPITSNNYAVNASASIGGSMENSTMTYGTSTALRANAFTLTGWTFSGWNTAANGSGTNYADNALVSDLVTEGEVTLYARWIQNCNAVTLSPHGGSSNSIGTLYKKSDQTGWFSNGACTTAWSGGSGVIPTRSADAEGPNGYVFRGFFDSEIADVR